MYLRTVVQVSVLVTDANLVAGRVLLRFQNHSRIKELIEQVVMDTSGRRLIGTIRCEFS